MILGLLNKGHPKKKIHVLKAIYMISSLSHLNKRLSHMPTYGALYLKNTVLWKLEFRFRPFLHPLYWDWPSVIFSKKLKELFKKCYCIDI